MKFISKTFKKNIYGSIEFFLLQDYKKILLNNKISEGKLEFHLAFRNLKMNGYFFKFLRNSPFYVSENISFFFLKKNDHNTFLRLLKNNLVGSCFGWFSLLELIGRNYTVYNYKSKGNQVIYFDLGFSHNILFHVPKNVKVFCRKKVIFVYGSNLSEIKSLCQSILNLKPLNVYKGKGLKFLESKVILKMGKQSQYN